MTELLDKIAPRRWTVEALRGLSADGWLLAAMLDCIERAGDLRNPEIMQHIAHELGDMVDDLRSFVDDPSGVAEES